MQRVKGVGVELGKNQIQGTQSKLIGKSSKDFMVNNQEHNSKTIIIKFTTYN